jgi:hypothetical protein
VHTTVQLLDALRAKLNLRSDYALGKYLGVTQMTVTRWRQGGSLSDDNAIRFAHLLDLSPAYVLACMGAQRCEEDTEASGTWRQIADAFKDKVAVAVLLATLGFSLSFSANDASASESFLDANNIHYAKLRRDRRRRLRAYIKAA